MKHDSGKERDPTTYVIYLTILLMALNIAGNVRYSSRHGYVDIVVL